jgi:hypothetical protein
MFGKRANRQPRPVDTTGEPLRNTSVVEAMKNVSVADTAEARALLFQLLLETNLVAATPRLPDAPGTHTVKAGETLDLITFADPDGPVLPLFTSADAVSRWRPEPTGIVALPSRALFEMAAVNGTNKIAIDPGSPTSGYLTRYEIEQLARGRLPLGRSGDVVAEATEVRIGKPANPPPPQALTAIQAQLDAEPRALRAWYFLMQRGTQPPELVIAIQFALGADPQSGAMRTVIDAAGQECESVRSLSFIVADESWQTSLASGAGELFFTRT